MFAAGDRVAVAVSGGPDSVCLLLVLRELAPRWNLHLSVAHLNHHLRGAESDEDARFVQQLAGSLGLPCHLSAVDTLQPPAGRPDNLEQAARRARRAFFASLRSRGLADKVALGHTLSDQAETVLFRLLRGAGPPGLAAILPVTAEGLVRPLLTVTRDQVLDFLRQRGQAFREDSTNPDPRFARNRIRRDLLPALTRDWNPSLPCILAHLADLARDDEAFFATQIEAVAPRVLGGSPFGPLLDTVALSRLPLALARRVLRYAISLAKGDLRRVEFHHIERLLALSKSSQGSGSVDLPGVRGIRSFHQILLETPAPPRPPYLLDLVPPARFAPPGGCFEVQFSISEDWTAPECVYNDSSAGFGSAAVSHRLDWDSIPTGLILRNWKAGDCYQPAGSDRSFRLKELFAAARVPSWERPGWPILCLKDASKDCATSRSETIVWSRRFGPAAGYAATARTRRVLVISEFPVDTESNRRPAAS